MSKSAKDAIAVALLMIGLASAIYGFSIVYGPRGIVDKKGVVCLMVGVVVGAGGALFHHYYKASGNDFPTQEEIDAQILAQISKDKDPPAQKS